MMWVCPVLPQVNGLPRTQRELTRHDRNHDARVRHGRTEMRGHVVQTFVVVFIRCSFGSELIHPAIEIA